MASFALICALAAGCLASDGTTQPQGTAMQGPIIWDGVTAFTPPSGETLAPWAGQQVYQAPPPPLTAAQQAAALEASGVTVTSASTPALNGTYALDASVLQNLSGTQQFITLYQSFPTGASMPWVDAGGTAHVFTDAVEFSAFAKAMAQLDAQIQLYGSGVLSSPPAMTVTLP